MFSHSHEQAVIASSLDAELAAYDEDLRELLQRRWDPDLYREISDHFDGMQMKAALLPRLAWSWTELLITRVDLMHALWTVSSPSRIDGKVIAYHARHGVLIAEVRRKCQEYMNRSGVLRT